MDRPLPPDAPWWARWLVEEWRDCWRWLSTWFTVLAGSAPILYDSLPSLQHAISPGAFHWIESGLVLLIFLGRIKRQSPQGVSP